MPLKGTKPSSRSDYLRSFVENPVTSFDEEDWVDLGFYFKVDPVLKLEKL